MKRQPILSSLLSKNRFYEKYAAPLGALESAWQAIAKSPLYKKTFKKDILPGLANIAGFNLAGAISDRIINDEPLPGPVDFVKDTLHTAPLYFGIGALLRGGGNIVDRLKYMKDPELVKKPQGFLKSILYPKSKPHIVPPLVGDNDEFGSTVQNIIRGAGWGAAAGALSNTEHPLRGAAQGALAFGLAHPLIWGPQWHGLEHHFDPNTMKGQFLTALRYQPEFSLFQAMQKRNEKINRQEKLQEYLQQIREQNPQFFQQIMKAYPEYFNN